MAMDDALKKGGEARKLAVSLSSLEYSGALSKQLYHFSDKMEKVYKNLRSLQDQKTKDPAAYEKFFKVLTEKFAWYNGAEAGHLLNPIYPFHFI